MRELVEKLNSYAGQKITMFYFNDFGFPVLVRAKLISAEDKPYAQYNSSVYLVFTPKGKSKAFSKRFLKHNEFAFFEGWQDIELDKDIVTKKEDYTIKESKYPCFDIRYYVDMLEQFKNVPCICKSE
jgi:hypothetical protein